MRFGIQSGELFWGNQFRIDFIKTWHTCSLNCFPLTAVLWSHFLSVLPLLSDWEGTSYILIQSSFIPFQKNYIAIQNSDIPIQKNFFFFVLSFFSISPGAAYLLLEFVYLCLIIYLKPIFIPSNEVKPIPILLFHFQTSKKLRNVNAKWSENMFHSKTLRATGATAQRLSPLESAWANVLENL